MEIKLLRTDSVRTIVGILGRMKTNDNDSKIRNL